MTTEQMQKFGKDSMDMAMASFGAWTKERAGHRDGDRRLLEEVGRGLRRRVGKAHRREEHGKGDGGAERISQVLAMRVSSPKRPRSASSTSTSPRRLTSRSKACSRRRRHEVKARAGVTSPALISVGSAAYLFAPGASWRCAERRSLKHARSGFQRAAARIKSAVRRVRISCHQYRVASCGSSQSWSLATPCGGKRKANGQTVSRPAPASSIWNASRSEIYDSVVGIGGSESFGSHRRSRSRHKQVRTIDEAMPPNDDTALRYPAPPGGR